jgi:Domain of unknown function (DUF397)
MFKKSSYSFANGNCVEADLEYDAFRKASYSNSQGACVEAGDGRDVVAVRDTKEEHLGSGRTVIVFPAAAWRTFTARVQGGML